MTDALKPPSTLETIHTDANPFQLFPQDKTHKRYGTLKKTIYDRHISLETNGLLPPLPVRLYTGATHMSQSIAISPYTNEGYPKDTADQEKDIDFEKVPLCLDATSHNSILQSVNVTQQKQKFPDPLLPEVQEILSRLRFHVTLPTPETLDLDQPTYETFVSQPDETALKLGELSFRLFTPRELPAPKACFLMLPSDDKIIQNIQGQFLLIPA